MLGGAMPGKTIPAGSAVSMSDGLYISSLSRKVPSGISLSMLLPAGSHLIPAQKRRLVLKAIFHADQVSDEMQELAAFAEPKLVGIISGVIDHPGCGPCFILFGTSCFGVMLTDAIH
jgi:hypothetical protein